MLRLPVYIAMHLESCKHLSDTVHQVAALEALVPCQKAEIAGTKASEGERNMARPKAAFFSPFEAFIPLILAFWRAKRASRAATFIASDGSISAADPEGLVSEPSA